MRPTELANLAAWAEARLPRLIDDAYTAIVERIAVYGRERLVPPDDLRRSVEHNLRFIVTAISRPTARLDLAAPQHTGRRRAHQGVPLPEVLRAYRVTFATLWDALVEYAHESCPPATTDVLLIAGSMIW